MREAQIHKNMCLEECEIYSRVVGYHRPLKNWNVGKQEEFKQRLHYNFALALKKVEHPNRFKVTFDENGDPTVNEI